MPVHAKEGHDFVIIGRNATLRRPFAVLMKDLETALKRLHAYIELKQQ
jgi:RNase P protein component